MTDNDHHQYYDHKNIDLSPSTTPSSGRSRTATPSSSISISRRTSPTSNISDGREYIPQQSHRNNGRPQPSSPSTASPAGLLFGGCCTSPSGRDSLDETQLSNKPLGHRKPPNTAELIRKLNQAEAEGQNIVHIARVKRKQAIERAKKEADEESRLYAEEFEIEFVKLREKHNEEMERFSAEANRRVEKDIAKESKKGQRSKQQTMFYVLDRTCDVDLSIPDVVAQYIQRVAASRPASPTGRGILRSENQQQDEDNKDSEEEFGLCPKHRSPDHKHHQHQSSASSSRQKSSTREATSSNSRKRNGSSDANDSPSKDTLQGILVSKLAAEKVRPSPR